MRLEKKVALITGAGSGIGRAEAILFAKEGAKVVVMGRISTKLQSTVSKIERKGGVATCVTGDVSVPEDVKDAIATTISRYGGLDIVVNSAGIDPKFALLDTPEDLWDEVMAVNLKGAFLLSKYAVPEMVKRGGGSIVNIGSTSSFFGYQGFSAYCASKGGLLLLTKVMALELGPKNIRVNIICPGDTRTPMFNRSLSGSRNPDKAYRSIVELNPLGRIASTQDVANIALFLVSSEAAYINGASINVDGGYSASEPLGFRLTRKAP